jgi:hypothetical protein
VIFTLLTFRNLPVEIENNFSEFTIAAAATGRVTVFEAEDKT